MKLGGHKRITNFPEKLKLLLKNIKLHYKSIISVLVILSIGLISTTWFGGNNLISAGDFSYFLSLQKNILLCSYMNLGSSPSALLAFLPLTMFELGGFTLVSIEKILFYFLFTFPGLSMYFLTSSLIKGDRGYLAGVISAFFYMMNTYTWQIKWSSGYIMSLFAYGALPLMLAFFIKGLNEKRNTKYVILIGLASLLAAPSGSTITYLVVIWLVLFLYLIYYMVTQRQQLEIFRSLKFTILSFVTWFLLNLWWITNEIAKFSWSTLSQTLSSESYSNILSLNSESTSARR